MKELIKGCYPIPDLFFFINPENIKIYPDFLMFSGGVTRNHWLDQETIDSPQGFQQHVKWDFQKQQFKGVMQ